MNKTGKGGAKTDGGSSYGKKAKPATKKLHTPMSPQWGTPRDKGVNK